MSTAIVWFKQDLRLHDHAPLLHACDHYQRVLPVVCLDPEQFQQHGERPARTGAFRARFLLESLACLRSSLQACASDLLVLTESPVTALPKIADQFNAAEVLCHDELAPEEQRLQAQVRSALPCPLRLWQGNQLYHQQDLPFSLHQLPDVFTSFRKQVEKYAEVDPPLPAPLKCPPLPEGLSLPPLPTLPALGLQEVSSHPGSALRFLGGEEEGRKRLRYYLWESGCIERYKETRNGLLGADYSSKFSPWLANGCLSPRLIAAEIRRYESEVLANKSTYWLFFELLWREYFRWVLLKYGRQLFWPGGLKGRPPTQAFHNSQRSLLERWKTGRTGMPFVDANMRELLHTGFMSNRGRQVVASYLVKDLGIEWRRGAWWFESMLLDYDVASNWGNWAYVAGVGNDPREHRYFNVLLQAKRYDKRGAYVRHWCPELTGLPDSLIHTPFVMNGSQQSEFQCTLHRDYPTPDSLPHAWRKHL